REFVYAEKTVGEKGSLKPEEAYNGGISFVQSFNMKGGKSSFSVDYYYTHFINQTIIDLDKSAQAVYIYNLNGGYNGIGNKSYSHSLQVEFILNPVQRFEIIAAYRFNDVRQTTDGKLQQKTLMSPHKALLNLNYATKFDKWKFSATLQYNSSMRLPNTQNNPVQYRLPSKSPGYFILNAQITKKYRDWEFYIGGENLLNYKQKNPILSANDPFGEYFDASIIYAPITGAMGYFGIRWTLK
ncbi:MAG: TonB-dependent receptor, partial [Flavobacterium sp.]